MEKFFHYAKKVTNLATAILMIVCVAFGLFYLEGYFCFAKVIAGFAIFTLAGKALMFFSANIKNIVEQKSQEKVAQRAIELKEQEEFEKSMLELRKISDEELERAYNQGKEDAIIELAKKFALSNHS